jgi:hypothetical protein
MAFVWASAQALIRPHISGFGSVAFAAQRIDA